MFKAELHKIEGGNEIHSMRQQNVIDAVITQMTQVRPPYPFSDKRLKPLFLVPADHVLTQHLQSVEMSQKSRQQPATSSDNPESAHEPKGPAGRPRDHGVPTETRTDPLWWESRTTGFIITQLSNRGWRKPHFITKPNKGNRSND